MKPVNLAKPFNLLFRWFVGLGVDDRVWDATVFTKNGSVFWLAKWRRAFWHG